MAEPPQMILPRRQTLPPPPAAFVENSVQIKGQNEPLAFSNQLNGFFNKETLVTLGSKNKEMWKEAEEQCNMLETTMEKLQKKHPEMKMDIRKSDWKQAMEELNVVTAQYHTIEGDVGVKQNIRKYLRKIQTGGATFESWLEVLPSGDYTSMISGAFRLVFKALGNVKHIREIVCKAASEIPTAMEEAKTYIEIYGSHNCDVRLLRTTADLVTKTLIALRQIIIYLTKNWTMRLARAILEGQNYEKAVTSSVADMTSFAQNLNREAVRCMHKRLYEMDNDQRQSHKQIRSEIAGLTRKVEDNNDDAKEDHELLKNILDCMYKLLASNPVCDRRAGGYIEAQPDQSLEARSQKLLAPPFESPLTSAVPSREPSPRPQAWCTPKKLIKTLNFDNNLPSRDIAVGLNSRDIIGTAGIDKAQWIIKSAKLRDWLSQSVESRELLIEGNHGPFEAEWFLSFFCAHLSGMLSPIKSAIVVSHVCRLHTDIGNDRDNAKGLLINLIGQLLCQRKEKELEFDLSWLQKDDKEALKEADISLLCRIFRKLVKQIQKNRIFFCILDGISWYGTSSRVDDMLQVLEMLQDLVRGKTKVLFKLLLTCSGTNLAFRNIMDSDEILWILDDVNGAGHGVLDTSASIDISNSLSI